MRTTLTLDPDVAQLLEEEVHRRRRSFKEVVNDAIRRAFSPSAPRKVPRYRLTPHEARLGAGVDRGALNQLADEIEAGAAVDRMLAGTPRAR